MKLDKIEKILGKFTMAEFEALSVEQLTNRIILAEQSMETISKELDENVMYQELKEQKKALESGKREVFKFQKAVIAYVLYLLESKGL